MMPAKGESAMNTIYKYIFNVVIFFGGLILIAITFLFIDALFCWWLPFGKLGTQAELLRNLIFSIGGIGGAIGLWLATKRQETFAEQVQTFTEQAKTQAEQTKIQIKQADTAETQLFNDRLGRGVELLANSDKLANSDEMLSKAGIRVLEDLANSVDVIKHKKIIVNILHDFIRDRTAINPKNPPPLNDKQSDVQLALDVYLGLMSLQNMVKPMQDFTNLDLRELDFSLFESQCDQNDRLKKLHSIDFSDSVLGLNSFKKLELVDCRFSSAGLHKTIEVNLGKGCVYFKDCIFSKQDILFIGSGDSLIFSNCNFNCIKMNVKQNSISFFGGRFTSRSDPESYSRSSIGVDRSEVSFIGTDISNVKLIQHGQCTSRHGTSKAFDDRYSDSCNVIYEQESDLSSFQDLLTINEQRAYSKSKFCNMYCFIETNAKWSEEPVDAWVAVELAELEIEENIGMDIDELLMEELDRNKEKAEIKLEEDRDYLAEAKRKKEEMASWF